MSEYKYINPIQNGFKYVKLNKKAHNKLFKYRQYTWKDRYEYFLSNEYFIIHRFISKKLKVLAFLSFPIIILLEGLYNFKEVMSEYDGLLHEKEKGKFTSDSIPSTSKLYELIIKEVRHPNL